MCQNPVFTNTNITALGISVYFITTMTNTQ